MRLKDIEVDEVSLVDKAANNKKFAFLKRDAEDHKEIEKYPPPTNPPLKSLLLLQI